MTRRLQIVFLMLTLAVAPALSQKPTTIRLAQTTDHIPGDDRRNDLNGNPCALVKVQVIDDIERIEGNKIGGIVKKGVEKWVYMCKGSRNMKIHLKNHLPVMVVFRDYDIIGLESNRVYELVLEYPDAQKPSGSVTVEAQVLKEKHANDPIKSSPEQNVNNNTQQPTVVEKKGTANMSLNDMAAANENSAVATPAKGKQTPPRSFDGEFSYPYDGSIFKCKAKKGYVSIISIDTNAMDIVIPSMIYYKGYYYPVKTLGTELEGIHYSVESMIIQEGIEIIEKGAFSKFRNIKNVTIPSTIMEIGKKAFRDVHNIQFTLPSHINEVKLRMGDAIKIKK